MTFTLPSSTNHSGAQAFVVNGESDGLSLKPADPEMERQRRPFPSPVPGRKAQQRDRPIPQMCPADAITAACEADVRPVPRRGDVVPAIGVPEDAGIADQADRRTIGGEL